MWLGSWRNGTAIAVGLAGIILTASAYKKDTPPQQREIPSLVRSCAAKSTDYLLRNPVYRSFLAPADGYEAQHIGIQETMFQLAFVLINMGADENSVLTRSYEHADREIAPFVSTPNLITVQECEAFRREVLEAYETRLRDHVPQA